MIDQEAQQLKLAKGDDTSAKLRLAQRFYLSDTVQAVLARDEYEWVREGLAQNPFISQKTQVKLARDTDAGVRLALALNCNIGEAAQKVLAAGYGNIVLALAQNLALTHDVQLKLAKSDDAEVRWFLAENPVCAPDVLDILAADESEEIREVLNSDKAEWGREIVRRLREGGRL